MEQKVDMNLFQIIDSSIVAINSHRPQEGIKGTIAMKRKITSEMMSTYFPSLLLMLITFATTFFKPFFFEAALSVNLTTMLVMTTIFISKMEGLPPTSDPKMIDFWLILCQLVPFAEVVLLTAMESIREVEVTGMKKRKKSRKRSKTNLKNIDGGGPNAVIYQDNDNVDQYGCARETLNPKSESQREDALAWGSPQETPWRKPSLMLVLKTLGKY